ncbi:ependymin-related protein 1-like isoform X2 [Branchiostoma lanceolatum]|uniref:ependymin-related protein 1-like isoform X2 n=1 Tax=Branchiostoma lanceolatum TaxID=7740 RepID=UPI0034547A7D
MMKLVAIALLVGGCSVVVETCCVPKQWECIYGGQNATFMDGKIDVSATSSMHSFDFVSKKLAFIGQDYKIVQDYNKMMQYTIIQGHCTAVKLAAPIHNCLPASAIVASSLDMGGPNGVVIDVYDIGKIAPEYMYKGTYSVNHDGCIPFSETLMTDGSIFTLAYINITSGIKDPSVFDVPSPPCPKDTDNFVNSLQDQPAPSWPILPSLP